MVTPMKETSVVQEDLGRPPALVRQRGPEQLPGSVRYRLCLHGSLTSDHCCSRSLDLSGRILWLVTNERPPPSKKRAVCFLLILFSIFVHAFLPRPDGNWHLCIHFSTHIYIDTHTVNIFTWCF